MADRLEVAAAAVEALGGDVEAARREAHLLRCCSHCGNVWTGSDLHNEEGELYDGHGRAWECNSRLCPGAQAQLRRRSRKRARRAVENTRLLVGEYWKLVTLTGPKLEALDLLDTIRLYNTAWRILTSKRVFWRERVRGALKGLEFTVKPSGSGFHVHIHVLVCGRWVEREGLRREWTEALKTAWREFGVEAPPINTTDGLALVDVRHVVNRRPKGHAGLATMEGALQECSKYMTKPQSWADVPDGDLVEIAGIGRWPRMQELTGCLLGEGDGRRGPNRHSAPSLDTQDLTASNGPSKPAPSDYLRGTQDWRARLLGRAGPQRCERRPSLRALGHLLGREAWEACVEERIAEVQEFRKRQLVVRFPWAQFQTLEGEAF